MGFLDTLTPENIENNIQFYIDEGMTPEEAQIAWDDHVVQMDSELDGKAFVEIPEVQTLINSTPAEISDWVDNADLEKLRLAIKICLIVCRFVIKKWLRA